jgi:hypothetical protein
MRPLLASCLIVAAAVPAAAQAPMFHIQVECQGQAPVSIQIVATGVGHVTVTIDELVAFCVSRAPAEPQKQKWRSNT